MRTGKPITLSAPQFFFAQDRALADEAYAGDVVGIPNHGTLRIGDTLTEGEEIAFPGVPNFAPEILRRVQAGRSDEGQEAERGAAANGGGGRRAGVPPARRRAGAGRRGRAVAARRAQSAARRTNTASTSATRRRNFSWRAGLPAPTTRSSTSSCRPIIQASPRISTATACSWRATSSSSITRASARRACFHRYQGREKQAGLIHLHIGRLDHRRPTRDFAIDEGAELRRRRADRLHQLRRQFVAHRRLLDDAPPRPC